VPVVLSGWPLCLYVLVRAPLQMKYGKKIARGCGQETAVFSEECCMENTALLFV